MLLPRNKNLQLTLTRFMLVCVPKLVEHPYYDQNNKKIEKINKEDNYLIKQLNRIP